MFCTQCASPLDAVVQFCPKCGSPTPSAQTIRQPRMVQAAVWIFIATTVLSLLLTLFGYVTIGIGRMLSFSPFTIVLTLFFLGAWIMVVVLVFQRQGWAGFLAAGLLIWAVGNLFLGILARSLGRNVPGNPYPLTAAGTYGPVPLFTVNIDSLASVPGTYFGTLNFLGGTPLDADPFAATGVLSTTQFSVTVAAPEPSSMGLLLMAILPALAVRRFRRRDL